MKKLMALILIGVMLFLLVSCSEALPSGHADRITYNSMGAFREQLYDVDYEYVTSNLIKITTSSGGVYYMDSANVVIFVGSDSTEDAADTTESQ